uniref:Uncharacterized protein n=1 Tax=Anguilla anguilla TaxID=7936 RepID=A0A0E9UJ76_ANGAN
MTVFSILVTIIPPLQPTTNHSSQIAPLARLRGPAHSSPLAVLSICWLSVHVFIVLPQ